MPSRKHSYRRPVSFLGEALGSAPWIPCPSVGIPWRVRSRVTEQYYLIIASSTSNTSSASICKENERVDCHYDRWFVVQSVDSDHPVSKLSPFVLDKAVRSAVGSVKTLRRLQNGDFLLEVASAVQSGIVNRLDNLAGCPVTTSPHRTLNTCKGVVRCGPLVNCDKEETLKELQSQGVKDIFNITVKDDSGGRRNINTFIVTFETPFVPKYIIVGYI